MATFNNTISPGASAGSSNVVLAQAAGGSNRYDPEVTARLEETLRFAELRARPTNVVAETLADSSLTQAQKDEYVARVLEMAQLTPGRWTTLEGLTVTPPASDNIRQMFENIGDAWTGPETPELRQAVAESIGRGVDNGRITAADLHAILDAEHNPISDGARSLLTEVTDGAVLDRLSGMLLSDARAIGYRGNAANYSRGVAALTAAADVANMAAANGRPSAANAVIDEIAAQTAAGEVFDGATIAQAMMAVSQFDRFGGPEAGRSGFEVLSTLLTSATTSGNAERRAALDGLFGELVRSGEDNIVGGVDQFYGNAAGLDALGTYFDANVSRLMQQDWRLANTGDPRHGVVQDFVQHVMLNDDFGGLDSSALAISDEMGRLSTIIGNEYHSDENRLNAATTLGGLMGSIQEAGRLYVAEARSNADEAIDNVRTVTDLVTGNLTDRAGPLGDAIGGKFVDALWDGLAQRAEDNASAAVDDNTGGLVDLGQVFRSAMSELDAGLLNGFDDRLDQYYDGPDG